MLRSIFFKTLFEKRMSILWWTVSGFLLMLFIISFFHTFEQIGQAFKNVPDSLKAFTGSAADYGTLTGYLDVQGFVQMIFLPIIFGIILFTGLLAGEENEGTLQTLLSYPVSRTRIFFEKMAASAVILAIMSFGTFFVAGWFGSMLIRESLSLTQLFEATLMAWLISFVWSMLGFSVGAITGSRGLSGAVAGILAFTAYLVTTLAAGVKSLAWADKISPFHYYNKPSVIRYGLHWSNLAVLLALIVVFTLVGHFVFKRRDIYQR